MPPALKPNTVKIDKRGTASLSPDLVETGQQDIPLIVYIKPEIDKLTFSFQQFDDLIPKMLYRVNPQARSARVSIIKELNALGITVPSGEYAAIVSDGKIVVKLQQQPKHSRRMSNAKG